LIQPQKTRRTRLAPEERSQLILDAAAQIVVTEGVSAVSMDRLGREAGISKALVYNYFPNRSELLRALLLREERIYQAQQLVAAESAPDVATLIRVTTRAYLDHVAEKGVLIERLMNEPSIAKAMGEMERLARARTVEYFAIKLKEGLSMPIELARMTTELGMGLTGAGGAYLDQTGCNIDLLEDMIVSMLMANFAAVEKSYTKWRHVETAGITAK
jgi:AcrR family transcriptional regulator